MSVLVAADVRAAYSRCEQITRTQAKNFAYGIALLPTAKRRALSAVYAFARRVDDIGDGVLPAELKMHHLERTRSDIESLAARGIDDRISADPVLLALGDAAKQFPIPLPAFGELIDGCEADVRGTRYATFAELEHYCRCVAGSIGRLSLGVFGCADVAAAEPLADALGIALQLTNILRDIREDLGNGRVYLPAEDLERFGCGSLDRPDDLDGASGAGGAGLESLIRFEAERARQWYEVGLRLLPMLDRRSAACTGAMAGIYRRLLDHISASPDLALRHRMSLPAAEKARVAAAALAGTAVRSARRSVRAAGQPGARP
jgi:phytoene synthase